MWTRKTGGMFLRTAQNGESVCVQSRRLALVERVSSRSCAVVRMTRTVFPSVPPSSHVSGVSVTVW